MAIVKYKVTVPLTVDYEIEVDQNLWFVSINRALWLADDLIKRHLGPSGGTIVIGDIHGEEVKPPKVVEEPAPAKPFPSKKTI